MSNKKMAMLVSPKGYAAYAWLAKKDTKFDANGVYKVTLVLDKGEIPEGRINYGKQAVSGSDWMKHVMQVAADNGASTVPGEPGCPIKDGDATGREEFEGKWMIPFKSAYTPSLIDSKGTPLPASVTINSGDVIKVAMQPNARSVKGVTYLSLYLSKVMLVEKSEGGSGDVAMFGDEDGFQVSRADVDDAPPPVDEFAGSDSVTTVNPAREYDF